MAAVLARDPGRDFDLQGFIDAAVRAGGTHVTVPPGRYRVDPQQSQHLVLRGLANVVMDCTGVEMICTETTRALTITDCTNVTLRGLTIDYDPLPFTQGRITGLSPDKRVHEVTLFDGYPRANAVRNEKYEVFRPDTRLLRRETPHLESVEVVDDARLRLTKAGGGPGDPEEVGDLVVIAATHAPGGFAAHAVECSGSRQVNLEDVSVYASNCFGFLEHECVATIYRRCRYDRRPPETDLVARDPRIRSGNADAFHSKHAIVGPRYLECIARFMGDDAVNICGDYSLVVATAGRTLRVLAKQDLNLRAGDTVELVAFDGSRLPDARVTEIRCDEAIRPDEKDWLVSQRMHQPYRTNADGHLSKGYEVDLDRDVDLPRGSVVASTQAMGNGFVIDRCTFGSNRSRGILIKASHGTITNCTLQGSWEIGILVSPEWWWLESGSSTDLVISGNSIIDCTTPGIVVVGRGGNGQIAPVGAHRNISIVGNTFRNVALPCILCTSTEGLTLSHNRFSAGQVAQATWGSDLVPPDKKGTPVVTVNCTLLLGGGEVATMNELWDVSRLPLPMVDCPYLRQEPNSCTATSLAMLLAWAGICDHQAVLKSWKDMGGRTDALCAGDPQFIWKFCDARGIRYEHGAGSMQKLKSFIDQGVPVYVLSQARVGDSLGHARVVVGYDEARSELIFHCPGSGGPCTRISFHEFDSLWGDFRWYNDERRLFFVVKK